MTTITKVGKFIERKLKLPSVALVLYCYSSTDKCLVSKPYINDADISLRYNSFVMESNSLLKIAIITIGIGIFYIFVFIFIFPLLNSKDLFFKYFEYKTLLTIVSLHIVILFPFFYITLKHKKLFPAVPIVAVTFYAFDFLLSYLSFRNILNSFTLSIFIEIIFWIFVFILVYFYAPNLEYNEEN